MFDRDENLIREYRAAGSPISLEVQLSPFSPFPTARDFEREEITRYFAQQTNQRDGEVAEVSKQTHNGLKNISMFRVVSLRWKIAGRLTDTFDATGNLERPGVETANRAAIRNAKKTISNIDRKLTNLLQLYRES